MQITLTREFACTPERLFSFLEEPEKQKQWMKGLLETQAVGEEKSGIVGSKFRMKIKEGRKVADYDGVITAYEKPKQLAIEMTGPTFPEGAVMHVDYRLADLGGRTRLDYRAEMKCSKPLPLWMRLLMPLFKVFGKVQLWSFMKALQRLAEQPAAG